MDIARTNLSRSDKPMSINIIPDDTDPNKERIGFRMSSGMWQPLRTAVNSGIVRPLTSVRCRLVFFPYFSVFFRIFPYFSVFFRIFPYFSVFFRIFLYFSVFFCIFLYFSVFFCIFLYFSVFFCIFLYFSVFSFFL